MIRCTCIVQEGQPADQNKTRLETALNQFTNTSFDEAADIAWIPVATGNGYTERMPSTSSVISIAAKQPLDSERRESLLRQLVALWTNETGCSVDEVVAVIPDPS